MAAQSAAVSARPFRRRHRPMEDDEHGTWTRLELAINREFIRESMSTHCCRMSTSCGSRACREKRATKRPCRAGHGLHVAWSSASRRAGGTGLPMSDLVQEWSPSLMQASGALEPERRCASTYAASSIRSAMQDYILRNWSMVRTGTTAAPEAQSLNLRRLRARIGDGSGGPSTRRAAPSSLRSCGSTPPRSRRWRCVCRRRPVAQRHDQPDREDEWQDFLADERPTPEETVMFRATAARVRSGWRRRSRS